MDRNAPTPAPDETQPTTDAEAPTEAEAAAVEEEQEEHRRKIRLWALFGFALMGLLVLFGVIQLPRIARSISLELFGKQASELYEFPSGTLLDPKDEAMLVDNRDFYTMSFLSVDEADGLINFVVSGNRQCDKSPCGKLKVIIYSMHAVEPYRRGLPPSVTFEVDKDEQIFSEQGQLPLIGRPGLYPADRYDLRIAVSIVRENDDGTITEYTEQEFEKQSIATVRNAVHNFLMRPPTEVAPETIDAVDDPYPFIGAMDVRFQRPTYLTVLAIMLVIMIGISSIITMFSRNVTEALLSVGGIVIGVWGVRSILVPSSVQVITAIDIALSLVIMFLLLGIGFRIVKHLYRESQLPPPIPPQAQRLRRDRPRT